MCPFVRWIWNNTKDVKPIPFDESDYTWEVTVSGADDQLFKGRHSVIKRENITLSS